MTDNNDTADISRYDNVEQLIIHQIIDNGPITFAEFMDKALYYPELGYYVSTRKPFGDQGDFITNLDKGTAFTSTLSNSVFEMWDHLGRPKEFCIIDMGAGRGGLIRGLLSAIKRKFPELYSATTAYAIDKSFRERKDPGRSEDYEGRLQWKNSLAGIEGLDNAVILCNELFDALPFHRVVNDGGELKEIFVTLLGDQLVDDVRDLSTNEIREYFQKEKIKLRPGQKADIFLKTGFILTSIASVMKKGFLITIDYGHPAVDLFGSFPNGTMLCHYRHSLNDNPYINIGEQDITAHINFSQLKREGEDVELFTEGFTKQSNFLIGSGIQDDFRELQSLSPDNIEDINHNRGLKELIMPGGMGDTFNVMVQSKGFGSKSGIKLKGFSMRNFTDRL